MVMRWDCHWDWLTLIRTVNHLDYVKGCQMATH